MTRPPLAAALDLGIGVGATFAWGWAQRVREWQQYGAATQEQSSASTPPKVGLPLSERDGNKWMATELCGIVVFSAILFGVGSSVWGVVSKLVH